MSIQIQLCATAIVVILVMLLANKRKIVLRSQKLFQFILGTNFVSIVINSVFIIIMNRSEEEYEKLEAVLSKLYTISIIFLCGLAFIYFTMEISRSVPIIKKINWYAMLITTCSSVAVLFMPVYFQLENKNVYSYGMSVNFSAIFILFSNVFVLILMMRYRRYVDRRRWEASLLWMFMWFISATLQYTFHRQVSEFTCALGMCVLFIKLENPESLFNRDTGLFNEQSLSAYLSHYYDKYQNFSMLVIDTNQILINDGRSQNASSSTKNHLIIMEISNYVDSIGDAVVFHHANNNLTMLFEDKTKMYAASKIIQKRFSEEWFFETFSVILSSVVFEIPDCNVAENEVKLLELVRNFIRESVNGSSAKLFTLDNEWILKIQKDKEMASIISEAIDQDKVEVFYQPIYSTSLKRYVSAEALVRIRKNDGGLIMPGEFISVAEKNGLIVELGKMVFRKACVFIKENNLEEKGINYLEINLSAVQCVKKELADQYIEIMDELEINPSMINLEITESAALSSKENLISNMEKLIDYGVEFSLDDFGTGYSNLNYITELPVSIVKFDRQMTNSYFESQKGKLVMEAAIGMIKAVGTKIVSEGVETKHQFDTLENVCIDYIQGYYFSKPISGDDFLKLLENNLAKK